MQHIRTERFERGAPSATTRGEILLGLDVLGRHVDVAL